MVSPEVPQWLLPAWVRACTEAHASAPISVITEMGQRLIDRWSEPQRAFHNERHLADVLERIDEMVEEAAAPTVVRLAAWFHGVILDDRGGEDRHASAQVAAAQLPKLGLPSEIVERVQTLISALASRDGEASDFDVQVLSDADLSVLAAEPQRYARYLTEIRQENLQVPDSEFWRIRHTIVSRLLARPKLFLSPRGAEWEDAARQNLIAEQARLAARVGRS